MKREVVLGQLTVLLCLPFVVTGMLSFFGDFVVCLHRLLAIHF